MARSSRGVVAAPSEAAFQLLMASVNMRTGDCILHSLPPCGACLTHIVFYWPPLHIYRIEAMAAKPDQDAEHVGALQHERMLECDRQPTWLGVLFCRWDNK